MPRDLLQTNKGGGRNLLAPKSTPRPVNSESIESGTPTTLKNYIPRVGETAFNLGVGAGKGVLSTLQGLSAIGQKTAKALGIQKDDIATLPKSLTEPTNTPQKIGKVGEQIGEFFIPLGGGIKATSLLPRAGKVATYVAKTVGESTEFALKTAAQSGGDIKQTTGTFLLSLALSPVISAVSGVLSTAGRVIPERLYSVIFKNAESDLRAAYQSSAKGKALDPTLAREVLDRGLRGNSRNMAVLAFNTLDDLERAVQTTVKNTNQPIVVGNKATYIRFLEEVVNTFKGGFYSGRARAANALIKELGQTGSRRISMSTALKMRRFIDAMRNTSSFRLNPNLTARQEEFKYAADFLRGRLAKAGLEKLMNEERIYIEAIDAIIADAIKRNNKNVIGLVDLLAGGGGMVAGGGLGGVTAAAGIRAFQSPFNLTQLGSAIDKLTKMTTGLGGKMKGGLLGGERQIKAGQSEGVIR